MSTRKRGFIEIIGELLTILNEKPLKKSHIAHKCNLDPRAVSKYLEIIIHLKLVQKSKDLQHYMLTQKGIGFVKKFHNLTKLLENNHHR